MVALVNVVLTPSHNHNKITTKLQNNYHHKPPEIYLNGSPTPEELKKKPHWDDRRIRDEKRVDPHSCVADKNQEREISAAEVPLRNEGS